MDYLKELVSFSIIMGKFIKEALKMGKNRDLDMNIILIARTIQEILFVEKEKVKANLNGVMVRCMMESGRTIKRKAVVFGKDQTNYLMQVSGIMMLSKDLEF